MTPQAVVSLQILTRRKEKLWQRKKGWIDPWTLEKSLEDYYELCYPYESSRENDEFVSRLESEIRMAYNDIELLYEVFN